MSGNGPDVVLAGSANDYVDAGTDDSRDVLIGDNGRATFDADTTLRHISSEVATVGGSDTLLARAGADYIVGGRGFDTIDAGVENDPDVILGDSGFANFDNVNGQSIIRHVEATDPEEGHDDSILAGDGPDVVVAGSGNDTVDAGDDASRDVLLGDNGRATFDATGVLTEIRSTSPEFGGDDELLARDGDDFVVGGRGRDVINAGLDDGADVVLGDNGFALFDSVNGSSLIRHIESSSPEEGDDDQITAGDGPDVVVAGSGSDTVDAGSDASRDVLLGDNGRAIFDATEVLIEIRSTDPTYGGDDTLLARNGHDFVIGGTGKDEIDAGTDAGIDVVMGDNGFATFDNAAGASLIRRIESTDPEHGDDDHIVTGDGPDVVVAGGGADVVDAGSDAGRDVLLGDNGVAVFDTDETVLEIRSTAPSIGGNDRLLARDGNDFVIGGRGLDYIDAGTDSGTDIVLGDNGLAEFDNVAGTSLIRHIESSDPLEGDSDDILTGNGFDVVVAGSGADVVDAGSDDSRDIILGDNGYADFDAVGNVDLAETTSTSIGGADRITSLGGRNVILGGANNDTITTGDGADIVLGDNGKLTASGGWLTRIISQDPAVGGARHDCDGGWK